MGCNQWNACINTSAVAQNDSPQRTGCWQLSFTQDPRHFTFCVGCSDKADPRLSFKHCNQTLHFLSKVFKQNKNINFRYTHTQTHTLGLSCWCSPILLDYELTQDIGQLCLQSESKVIILPQSSHFPVDLISEHGPTFFLVAHNTYSYSSSALTHLSKQSLCP